MWLEGVKSDIVQENAGLVANLKMRLDRYGLADRLALWCEDGVSISSEVANQCLRLDDSVGQADLLLNLAYGTPGDIVRLAKRAALVDIDPGLLQTWVNQGDFSLPPHDVYFTIGETVGTPDARFPDLGLPWNYTPPCVSLRWWQIVRAPASAPFDGVPLGVERLAPQRGRRAGLERKARGLSSLPRFTASDDADARAGAPDAKRQGRRGSGAPRRSRLARSRCVGRCCESLGLRTIRPRLARRIQLRQAVVRAFQNAWISDRTLCYLACGKPAVVQHTGPSRFLPDDAGLCRFHDLNDAAQHLEDVSANYERHSRCARAIAEEHFDARKVATRVLERALS